jgi:hypothetical protein
MKKSTRFEVFKRDKFTCQYCGRSAPDVILQVDHIHPRAEGGDDDLLNLVTSCQDCNQGKSDRLLSDDTAVQKRKAQLDDLQERREQIEMMMDWHRSLIDLDGQSLEGAAKFWEDLIPGYSLSERGLDNLKKHIKKFGLSEVLESLRIATDQYLIYDPNSENPAKPTQDSVEKVCQYIPRICTVRKNEREKPYIRELYYIRGILKKRRFYVNDWEVMHLMEKAIKCGYSTDEIKDLALEARNWTGFTRTLEEWIDSTKE